MFGRLRCRSYFHPVCQFPLIVLLFKHGYKTETCFVFCKKYAFCGKTFREICNATCHSLYSIPTQSFIHDGFLLQVIETQEIPSKLYFFLTNYKSSPTKNMNVNVMKILTQ
uniref:(northern house mosquito) hypothetical protein n=1 Tax=Culex pipiens TaxID=7175 RepID=A0A8D8AYY3_CULPI